MNMLTGDKIVRYFFLSLYLFFVGIGIYEVIIMPDAVCKSFWLVFLIVSVLFALYSWNQMFGNRPPVFSRVLETFDRRKTVTERKWSTRKGRPVYYKRKKWRW